MLHFQKPSILNKIILFLKLICPASQDEPSHGAGRPDAHYGYINYQARTC